jgi:GNAT superfamily N-acetyltransferase
MRVDLVDPTAFAETASWLLREAGLPPRARYTPEYLRWQLTFPGPAPPLAAAVRGGAGLAGFAAVTPRAVRFRGERSHVYVLSFVVVDPAWRGRGVAARLYAVLLDAVRQAGLPVVTFAVAGSPGHRMLLRAYEAGGFVLRPLGSYAVHGLTPGPRPEASPWRVTAAADLTPLPRAAEACADPGVLWSAPEAEELSHYARDPRGRGLVVARGRGGAPTGAALAVGPEGDPAAVVVDTLFASRPDPALVRDLCGAASGCFPGRHAVLASNVRVVPPDVLRAAGLRRLPQGVEGYLCAADGSHPLLRAEATNLEVL